MPEISVLMPVFNGEKFIRESVESILNQTLNNFELIIIDDGSVDETEDIIKSIKDPRIRYIKNEQNKGIVYSRNKAFELAKGDFYAISDSDDISLPDRFEKQINFLKENQSIGMVGSFAEKIDERGNKLNYLIKVPTDPETIKVRMLFENAFVQSSVMIRRNALPQGGYSFDFKVSEDYDLWIRMSETNLLANLPESLVLYRIHGNNISSNTTNIDMHDLNLLFRQISKIIKLSDEDIGLLFSLIRRRVEKTNEFYLRGIKLLEFIYMENLKEEVFNNDSLGLELGRVLEDMISIGKFYDLKSYTLLSNSILKDYVIKKSGDRLKFYRRIFKHYIKGK